MDSDESTRSGFGDVFILGAGFSKGVSKIMPLMSELSAAIALRLSAVIGIKEIPFLSEDVELAMTFLSQPQPWLNEAERLRNRAMFLELTEAVATAINAKTDEVLAQPIPAWLVRLVHWMHFQRAVVITLNYDTLLESAIAKIPGDSCFPRGLVPFLLKLHGPVNWRYSGRTSYAGELIHWSGFGAWGGGINARTSSRTNTDTVPLIVPPVADKGSYFAHHSVQHLWRKASEGPCCC
jgi:hypothetical protein